MKVEIWSDVVCPWCGIGQHRLDQAIASFEHREDVEIVHHSFQLDASAPPSPKPVREMLAKKYGMDEAQLKATFGRIEALAASEGLAPYIVGDNLVGNTRLAHELLALATSRGMEDAAWKRLYRAYFGEQRSIFDAESLARLGEEIGLDPAEVRAAFEEGRFTTQVESDGRKARALGASGVPFVVIDDKYAVAGAQTAEAFREVLDRAWKEGHGPKIVASGEVCGPEGCEVPPTR